MSQNWRIRDRNRLLRKVMEELAGDAKISFEGDLGALQLSKIAGASSEETGALKRSTTWPRQDFVVVPLDTSSVRATLAAIGGTIPRSIIHVQIAKLDVLEFGAYDNFHPGCLFLGKAFGRSFIESLENEGVIEREKNER